MGFWQSFPQADEDLIQLYLEDRPYKEICDILSRKYNRKFSYFSVVNRLRRLDNTQFKVNKKELSNSNTKEVVLNTEGLKRYLIISDTHIPFELAKLNDLVKSFQGKVDGLIIAGDYLDQYSVSRFSKDKEVSLQQELVDGYAYLKEWTSIFPEVVIIKGNHDSRIDSFIQSSVKETILFLIPENFVLRHYVTGFIVKDHLGGIKEYPGLPNLKIIDDFYYQVGDCIIAHPHDFWSIDGKTAIMTDEYFLKRGYKHNALIIGHTHKAIKIVHGNNRILIETGCLCREMDYSKKGKVKYRPQTNAYTILVQRDGITDINETNYYIVRS